MRGPARLLAVLLLAATALSGWYASGWSADNRVRTWMRSGPERDRYELLVERFGGDEVVLLRALGFELDGAVALGWLAALGPRLAELPAVASVLDPFQLPGAAHTDPAAALAATAERPLGQALDLVELDPPRADFVLTVAADAGPDPRRDLARELEALEREGGSRGLSLLAAGHPLVSVALDGEAARVERVFAPFLVLATFAVVALVLRSAILAGCVVLPAGLASLGLRAALRLADWPATMVLVAAGPLAFVILAAAVLHPVCAFRRECARGLDGPAATRAALACTWRAGLLGAGTTALGFAVFALSPVESVSRLGRAVAGATALGVPLAYLALAVLLAGLAPRVGPPAPSRAGRWGRIAVRAARRRGPLLAAVATILVLGALAPFGWPWGTNALDYFPAAHPVRSAFLELESGGGGLSSIELIARAPAGRPFEAAELEDLDLAGDLSRAAGVRGVFGPEAVLADVEATSPAPLVASLSPAALHLAGRSSADGELARWTVRVKTGGHEEIEVLERELLAIGRARLGGRTQEIFATGMLPAVMGLHRDLLGTLAISLGLSVLVTTLLFLVLTRSPRELFAALAVNLFPVATVLALARLFGFPLESATAMVAAAVLGLAVDNTFHILHAAGHGARRRSPRARLQAFRRVAPAAATSSLALAGGFAILALSGFGPTARFGALMACGVLGALVADLVLLPALWLVAPSGQRVHRHHGPDGPQPGV